MNIFQRAYYYVVRKREKSILLLLILVALLSLILVGNVIGRSADNTKAELYKAIGGYFKISVDYNQIENSETVDKDLVENVMKIDGVNKVNPLQIMYLTAPEIMLKPSKWSMEGDSRANLTSFIGCTDSSLHEYFKLKFFVLENGRHIGEKDRGTIMISTDISEQNQLQIGDKIKALISEEGYPRSEAIGEEVELEIIGIFSDVYEQEGDAWIEERALPANFMFIDLVTSQKLSEKIDGSADIYNAGAMFLVSEPERLEKILSEVKEIEGIDWDELKIAKNNYTYEKNAASLESLNNMTTILVIMTMVTGLILIALLLILWQRDRIHEVGVLLSVGVSKKSIFLQHLLESVFIFIAAFCITMAISGPLSNQVGEAIYGETKVKVEETVEMDRCISMYEPVDLSVVDSEATLEIEITPDSYLFTGMIGILVILLSLGISFAGVLRKDPGEIMLIME